MEPGRFDDVEFQILEGPEQAPRGGGPRRRRLAVALIAAAVLTGGLTAGASALTGSGDEPAQRAAGAKQAPPVTYDADGVPTVRDGRECRGGKGRHHGAKKSTLRY